MHATLYLPIDLSQPRSSVVRAPAKIAEGLGFDSRAGWKLFHICHICGKEKQWTVGEEDDCGQTVHQCLTAPLEITSFGWKTPQIPSGGPLYILKQGLQPPLSLSA